MSQACLGKGFEATGHSIKLGAFCSDGLSLLFSFFSSYKRSLGRVLWIGKTQIEWQSRFVVR